MPRDTGTADDSSGVSVETAAPGVALLRVAHFEVEIEDMAQALAEIAMGDFSDLVIDLRGNEGGSFPSVLALARFLTNQETDAGIFLTRRWFARHGDYPDAAARASIPALAVLDLEAFAQQLAEDGAVRLVLPAHDDPVFAGRVIVLTDSETASASEPFVDLMQQAGAHVVGERTAGKMLSAERFPVDDTFRLFVPVADYMTADGRRLDGNGVKPDLQVPAAQALEQALELIAGRDQPAP